MENTANTACVRPKMPSPQKPQVPAGQLEMSILLVEDTDTDAFVVTRILEQFLSQGCHITRVGTLEEAERTLATHGSSYDVILLDLGLPDSSSPEDTYHRVKHYMAKMPVIVLTCLDDHNLAVDSLGLGAQDYLCKNDIVLQPSKFCNAIEFSVLRHRDHAKSMASLEKEIEEKSELLYLMAGGYSAGH